MSELGPSIPLDGEYLQRLVGDENERLSVLNGLLKDADALSVALTAEAAPGRKLSLESQRSTLSASIEKLDLEVAERDRTWTSVGSLIDALRGAADDYVGNSLRTAQPLLDRIYDRIDPHPAFTHVELATRVWRSRGRLTPTVADPEAGLRSDHPEVVLSSSQLNAYATSLFLTINLALNRTRLGFVLLDDPFQSLDDVHLLAVVDLLRTIRPDRQLVISTHDDSIAALLMRKLRPVAASDRTVALTIGPWSRSGPELQYADQEREDPLYRLVVA